MNQIPYASCIPDNCQFCLDTRNFSIEKVHNGMHCTHVELHMNLNYIGSLITERTEEGGRIYWASWRPSSVFAGCLKSLWMSQQTTEPSAAADTARLPAMLTAVTDRDECRQWLCAAISPETRVESIADQYAADLMTQTATFPTKEIFASLLAEAR